MLAEDLCTQCGLELGSTSFRNSSKQVLDNFFINNEQCRVVAKEIAKIAFSWARIGQDNKLYFDFNVKNKIDIVKTFTLDDYIDLENNNETIPINTIILKASYTDVDENGDVQDEGQDAIIQDDDLIEEYGVQKALVIEEDYFAYDKEKRDDLITAGAALFGLTYYPIKINSIGTCYLESNDYIKIIDRQGKAKYSYCINHTIDYNGALFDSIESPALTETETKYQKDSDLDLALRKTEIKVNKAEQKINATVEEVNGKVQQITDLELAVGRLAAKVELIADTTKEINSATGSITIPNALKGELLELHIYGNNTVFSSLLVSENTYVSNNTVMYGDSIIKVYAERKKKDENGNETDETEFYHIRYIDLGIEEPLRQLGEIRDEYILKDNKAQIIKRIGVTSNGTLYELNEEEHIDLGELIIELDEGTNYIEIQNYTANMSATYVILNDFTKVFTTTAEFKSTIEILYNNIQLLVSEKVGEDEIIAAINLAVENEQGVISIKSNLIEIMSDYTQLTKYGEFTTKKGNIGGLTLTSYSNGSYLYKNFQVSGKTYQSGIYIPNSVVYGNSPFIYAGSDMDYSILNKEHTNCILTHDGQLYAKWIDTNGEDGHFHINYNSGNSALNLNKDGIRWLIDNDTNNNFALLWKAPEALYWELYDAPMLAFRDAVHDYSTILEIVKYNPNSNLNNALLGNSMNVYSDIKVVGTRYDNINYSIYNHGYEVLTTASDERLKDNKIICDESALKVNNKIQIISFDWKENLHTKDAGKHIRFGYGAQRTKKVFEDAVAYNNENDTYQMNLLNLSALHTKAIQELDEKVKKLEEENQYLKEQINYILGKIGG